jgi:hypothetical protein
MSSSRDWFLTTRDEQLAMDKNFVLILADKGPDLNGPDADVQELAGLMSMVNITLASAKNETARTPIATARRKEAFKQFDEKMLGY